MKREYRIVEKRGGFCTQVRSIRTLFLYITVEHNYAYKNAYQDTRELIRRDKLNSKRSPNKVVFYCKIDNK